MHSGLWRESIFSSWFQALPGRTAQVMLATSIWSSHLHPLTELATFPIGLWFFGEDEQRQGYHQQESESSDREFLAECHGLSSVGVSQQRINQRDQSIMDPRKELALCGKGDAGKV